MDNRRKAIRMDFFKSAQLITSDGTIIQRCEVRDLSSRGAKLILLDHDKLPTNVLLHMPLDGVMWPCRIMRRRGREIGVQFT